MVWYQTVYIIRYKKKLIVLVKQLFHNKPLHFPKPVSNRPVTRNPVGNHRNPIPLGTKGRCLRNLFAPDPRNCFKF